MQLRADDPRRPLEPTPKLPYLAESDLDAACALYTDVTGVEIKRRAKRNLLARAVRIHGASYAEELVRTYALRGTETNLLYFLVRGLGEVDGIEQPDLDAADDEALDTLNGERAIPAAAVAVTDQAADRAIGEPGGPVVVLPFRSTLFGDDDFASECATRTARALAR